MHSWPKAGCRPGELRRRTPKPEGSSWHHYPKSIQVEIFAKDSHRRFNVRLGGASFFEDRDGFVVEDGPKREAVARHKFHHGELAVIAGLEVERNDAVWVFGRRPRSIHRPFGIGWSPSAGKGRQAN